MTSIIQIQAEARRQKITDVCSAIHMCNFSGNFAVYSKLLSEICVKFGCSQRHAKELLDISIEQSSSKIIEKDGQKIIVPEEPSF